MIDETVESGRWWTVNPLSAPAELGVTTPQRILIRFSEHAHEPRAYLDQNSPLEMFIARLFRFGPSFFLGFGDWTVNFAIQPPPFSSLPSVQMFTAAVQVFTSLCQRYSSMSAGTDIDPSTGIGE